MEKEEFLQTVNQAVNQGFNVYQAILNSTFQNYYCIALDCSRLVEPLEYEPLPDEIITHFFSHLHKEDNAGFLVNKKACLYMFELVSHNAEQVKEYYTAFCNEPNMAHLNKSAIKKNAQTDTQFLYIGKVKKGIGNRMVTHFGYANPQIGGLQLKYWAKEIRLKLKVHIVAFDEIIDDYINPLELNLTKTLRPLIGKSK